MTDSILSNGAREEWMINEVTPTALLKKNSERRKISQQIKHFLETGNSIQKIETGRIAKIPTVSKYDLYEHVLG